MGLNKPTRRKFLGEKVAATAVTGVILISSITIGKILADVVSVVEVVLKMEKLGPKEDIEDDKKEKSDKKRERPCRSPFDKSRPRWDDTDICELV